MRILLLDVRGTALEVDAEGSSVDQDRAPDDTDVLAIREDVLKDPGQCGSIGLSVRYVQGASSCLLPRHP